MSEDFLWALHVNGSVFCRPLTTSGFAEEKPWIRTEGETSMRHVVADRSGVLWAVSEEDGSLHRREDVSPACPEGARWQLMDFKVDLDTLYFGCHGIWATCRRKGLLYRESMDDDHDWCAVGPPDEVDAFTITNVIVNGNGVPFLLTQSGDVYRRDGISSSNMTGISWSLVDPPPDVNGSMWRLLGYKEKPRAITADRRNIWCVVGQKGSDLWRMPSPAKPTAKSLQWEQTACSVAREGLHSLHCSQVGAYASSLIAVTARKRLAFCPNAGVREASALEWVELDSSDGWVCACILARKQVEPTAQQNGALDSDESDDEESEPTKSPIPMETTPVHRKYQRRRPSGPAPAVMVSPASQKRKHGEADSNATNDAPRKYIHLSGDPSIAIRLPFPAPPVLDTKLPPANADAFLRQYEYSFTLEQEIISAVEESPSL